MRFWFFIFSFLVLYTLGGRKLAVPYGVAFPNNLWQTIILTLALDFIQISMFYFIYDKSVAKLKVVSRLRVESKKRIEKSRTVQWAKNFGLIGVFILSTLPSFGGGIWSAVLLAFLLKANKKIAYLTILTGSLIGITLLAFFSHGIIQAILSFIH
jgi:uncharacterized membrane protein